jgi:hypothetical protein
LVAGDGYLVMLPRKTAYLPTIDLNLLQRILTKSQNIQMQMSAGRPLPRGKTWECEHQLQLLSTHILLQKVYVSPVEK